MLPATEREIDRIAAYMKSQAPDLTVQLVQKVYSENVLSIQHDVCSVHTDADRWWVITEPMNLYSQDQFPNMDLALTFHVGLCRRIPRTDRQKLSELPVEPFLECFRGIQEASDALARAEEVTDYQSIGVRCRETLLAFSKAAQTAIPWTAAQEPPKKADLKAWADHICSVALAGEAHKYRRQLFKALLESAWEFANCLTHTTSSTWYDAEAAISATENAVSLCISAVIRHIRGVPERCPGCGSQRLTRQRGSHEEFPDVEWEWPICEKCGWAGALVPVDNGLREESRCPPPEGECIVPTTPLRQLKRPQ